MTPPRQGRPRRYGYEPARGFAHPVAAALVAALDELTARHFDLIAGVAGDLLHRDPGSGFKSIAGATAHMIGAEAHWIEAVLGRDRPDEIRELLDRAAADDDVTIAELEATAGRVREEMTKPWLAPLADVDEEVPRGQRVLSVRGVLMHLVWHWAYHAGQCGLMAGLGGCEYEWALEGRMAGHAP